MKCIDRGLKCYLYSQHYGDPLVVSVDSFLMGPAIVNPKSLQSWRGESKETVLDSLFILYSLTAAVLGRVFFFIIFFIHTAYYLSILYCYTVTASETHLEIELVQTLAINLLASIDPS